MSGGYFNFQEMHLLDMGERLRTEEEPVLKATGNTLIKMAQVLQKLDRMYDGDDSMQGIGGALEELRELMPADKPLESMVEEAEETLQRLQRELLNARRAA